MEEKKVEQTIRDLFAGADERNWEKVAIALSDKVLLDYSSMNGIEASIIPSHQIIESWKSFLPRFDKTNHQVSDFTIELCDEGATVKFFGKAEHFLNEAIWLVVGTYDAELKQENGHWHINKLKLNLIHQSEPILN